MKEAEEMQEDIKQRNLVNRLAVVDIYLSGGNGRFYWPCRLQPIHDSTPSVRRECQKYIIDSGFSEQTDDSSAEDEQQGPTNRTLSEFGIDSGNDPEPDDRGYSQTGPTPKELAEMVKERRPDYIIPNDTVNTPNTDMRTAIEETAAKTADFLDYIDEDTFSATVIVPLQPNHNLHLAYLHEHYPEQGKRGHFALGGMKHLSPEEQVNRIKQFRHLAGYEPYVHAFGVGTSRLLIETLRDNPALLDSVDFSTPQHHARSGRIAGTSRIPMYVGTAQGKDGATATGQLMSAELTDIARMLAPSITSDEDIRIRWNQLEKQHERLEKKLIGELGMEFFQKTATHQLEYLQEIAPDPLTKSTIETLENHRQEIDSILGETPTRNTAGA